MRVRMSYEHTHTHIWRGCPPGPPGECFLALGFELQPLELCSPPCSHNPPPGPLCVYAYIEIHQNCIKLLPYYTFILYFKIGICFHPIMSACTSVLADVYQPSFPDAVMCTSRPSLMH